MGTSLDKLRLFQGGRVKEIDCEGAASQQLLAMGLLPGRLVKVVQKAPLGDPITVESERQRLSLRLADARAIAIESDAA